MTNSNSPSDTLPGFPGSPKSVRDHWMLFAVEGTLLILLGAAAILVPPVASLTATIFFGWLLVIGGILGVVSTAAGRHAPGFGWALFSGILAIIAGGALIGWPISGMHSLTLVLAAFLALDGFVSILYALEHRRHGSQRWAWLVVNGLLDLALAALILVWLPASAAWVLGLILGIDLIFAGLSLVAMALAARSLSA
jgi:uncharacterized membrane protein HdeD (DUF308 family)